MPHLHLETTADLPENADVPDILQDLIDTTCLLENINPAKVRAYHSLRSNWMMGAGSPVGFAHVTANVLSGRSAEWRTKLSNDLLEALKASFSYSLENHEVTLSVEVREMNREGYSSHR